MILKKTLLSLFAFAFLFVTESKAQETTSTLSGTVNDEKGASIAGATVYVLHETTGTVTTNQTNKKGIFVIPNLKPGGPYTIKFSFVGFNEETLNNINLNLGNNPDVVAGLKVKTQNLKEIVVNSDRKSIAGGIIIGRAQLSTLPTLGRSLSDFTRLTPQSNNNSFAGTNFRYNNLTIDGAINNDAIGFSNSFGGVSGGGQSGSAGAGTRTNPYSLDVIQEVQVQLVGAL